MLTSEFCDVASNNSAQNVHKVTQSDVNDTINYIA